jgi:hypothetical protein
MFVKGRPAAFDQGCIATVGHSSAPDQAQMFVKGRPAAFDQGCIGEDLRTMTCHPEAASAV